MKLEHECNVSYLDLLMVTGMGEKLLTKDMEVAPEYSNTSGSPRQERAMNG
jgi:hypothetical protein